MKRILTIICAIAFSGAALSAQNDIIKVSRNGSDTLVIIVKERQSVKKDQRLAERAQKPAYMINVGYNRGYRVQILNSHGQISPYGESPRHTDSVSETDSMSAEVPDSVQNSQRTPRLQKQTGMRLTLFPYSLTSSIRSQRHK